MDISRSRIGSDSATRVGLVLVDEFALLSYASVTEPLRAANLLSGRELYRVTAIPASGAEAVSSGQVVVPASAQIGERVDFDLVLVIAAGDPFSFSDDRVFQWLRLLSRRGVWLGGVSGGPVVMAAAGLMAGYRMTLHWEHASVLAERQPELMVERSLYVFDRDRLTCAGGTAPLDLMHALISNEYGAAIARRVSDWLQHTEVRPGGGAQRAGVVERYAVYHPPLVQALTAMETHLADPVSLEDLARLSGVCARQLTRLFDEHLGNTPMGFYRTMRLDQGRQLLRQTGLSITVVARSVGYSNTSHFSSAYKRQFDCTPGQERDVSLA